MMNPDYFALAVKGAQDFRDRQHRAIKVETHWNHYETPVDCWGETEAACGRRVKRLLISGDPTCPGCRAAVDAYNNLEF